MVDAEFDESMVRNSGVGGRKSVRMTRDKKSERGMEGGCVEASDEKRGGEWVGGRCETNGRCERKIGCKEKRGKKQGRNEAGDGGGG